MLTSAAPEVTMNSANKRRRLNDNAAILSKPFRSPLKLNDRQSKTSAHGANDEKRELPSPSQMQGKHQAVDDANSPAIRSEDKSSLTPEKDVVQLQREYAALCQQIKHRRQTFDVLQRALTIRTSDQREKLDKSIVKWQIIAREVADEVYASMNAQVKDMGGLQAMKKQSQDFANEWSNERQHPVPPNCGDANYVDDHSSLEKRDNEQNQSDVEEVKSPITCTSMLTVPD